MKIRFSTDIGSMAEVEFYTAEACRKFIAVLVTTNGKMPSEGWFRRYRGDMQVMRAFDKTGKVRRLAIDFDD